MSELFKEPAYSGKGRERIVDCRMTLMEMFVPRGGNVLYESMKKSWKEKGRERPGYGMEDSLVAKERWMDGSWAKAILEAHGLSFIPEQSCFAFACL